jgi:hypothetical protein
MNRRLYLIVLAAALAAVGSVRAEDPLDALKQQLQLLQQQVQQLQQKVAELEAAKTTPPPAAETAATTTARWTPSQPITLAKAGPAYMNISLDSLLDFGWSSKANVRQQQIGDHDPAQRGFTLPNTEFVFEGAVDPYFKGVGDVVLKLDEHSETTIELEEAYIQTMSLPWNLQLRAGQWFTEFGRHNPMHPHQWDFVDQPLIVGRMFGPEGLRNPGARLSWLVPTPFYTELFLTVLNGNGGTAFSFRNPEDTLGRAPFERGLRGPQDLVYAPRLASSFDIGDTQTLLLGASAAFGPNDTGADTRTQIYGVDAYWKWRPVNAQRGFPFVSWQTEAMLRRFEAGEDMAAGLPAETLQDYGFYTQLLYGFRVGWVAGLRGEFVTGNAGANDIADPLARGDRARFSPNLTWYPSEFSKLRLQYNFDHGQAFGNAHAVWLQLEFLLGAHAAHKF